MNWQEVCEHPKLQDLPFKVELNRQGQVLMTPVKVYHSLFQGRIAGLLYAHAKDGEALTECAIRTSKGTKVADVSWASYKRLTRIRSEAECSIAPEICIEVMSSANTNEEMLEKKDLYFESGATEVWICDEDGNIAFFSPIAKLDNSFLAPGFPRRLP
jgi:Uma2 family endonuclease